MDFVAIVCDWNIASIPFGPLASLVSSYEEDCAALRIENEENTKLGRSHRAWSKLLHIFVTGSPDRIDQRASKRWSLLFEYFQRCVDTLQGNRIKTPDPIFDITNVDIPDHGQSTTYMLYHTSVVLQYGYETSSFYSVRR